jgi:hypothetical protein
MTAGVTFGAPGAEITADPATLGREITTDYEEGTLLDSVRTGAAGVGLRHGGRTVSAPLFTIAPTSYTVVRSSDGVVATRVDSGTGGIARGVSQYEAVQARGQAVAADELEAAQLVVVPLSSAMEPV